jgi:hypothetical protein
MTEPESPAPAPADSSKLAFLMAYADQIEGQVQFGDTKASLLIAGDAILLGISGGLINLIWPATDNRFASSHASTLLIIGAIATSTLLVLALALALWTARPAPVHDKPVANFFLLSYIARLTPEAFIASYNSSSVGALSEEALLTIHGKARYAATKFRCLKWAIYATLLSLGIFAVTLLLALISTLTA